MKVTDRADLCTLFGARLRMLRLEKGLSPEEFYRKSNVDPANLRKYESGNREPGLVIIEIMAKALEVPTWELLNFEL